MGTSHVKRLLHWDGRSSYQGIVPYVRLISFRHVLNIAQHRGGPSLCTSLLRDRFAGGWDRIDAIVGCEAGGGGFLFAAPLAARVGTKLAVVRTAGKLPPPTIAGRGPASHISSRTSARPGDAAIEMERGVFHRGASVVVVDDVLASGETLCAVLRLVSEVGVAAENVKVSVVVELPVHRGREFLRVSGFGQVQIQSLLVMGSA